MIHLLRIQTRLQHLTTPDDCRLLACLQSHERPDSAHLVFTDPEPAGPGVERVTRRWRLRFWPRGHGNDLPGTRVAELRVRREPGVTEMWSLHDGGAADRQRIPGQRGDRDWRSSQLRAGTNVLKLPEGARANPHAPGRRTGAGGRHTSLNWRGDTRRVRVAYLVVVARQGDPDGADHAALGSSLAREGRVVAIEGPRPGEALYVDSRLFATQGGPEGRPEARGDQGPEARGDQRAEARPGETSPCTSVHREGEVVPQPTQPAQAASQDGRGEVRPSG